MLSRSQQKRSQQNVEPISTTMFNKRAMSNCTEQKCWYKRVISFGLKLFLLFCDHSCLWKTSQMSKGVLYLFFLLAETHYWTEILSLSTAYQISFLLKNLGEIAQKATAYSLGCPLKSEEDIEHMRSGSLVAVCLFFRKRTSRNPDLEKSKSFKIIKLLKTFQKYVYLKIWNVRLPPKVHITTVRVCSLRQKCTAADPAHPKPWRKTLGKSDWIILSNSKSIYQA